MPQKSQNTFNKYYKALNPEQKKAVDTIEGPVMVVAGPGTGKTQILTLRIANILRKTDADASSILALTFTESASYSMRKRLVDIIGSDAYKVNIHTFHGFANEIIKRYPEEFERIIGARNITEIDQIKILKTIFDKQKFKIIKPYGDPYYYLKPSLNAIRDLKREDISPDSFEKLLDLQKREVEHSDGLYHTKGAYKGKMLSKWANILKQIDKNRELVILYRKYQESLVKLKVYDFEDMIMEAVRVLSKNKTLLLDLQENFQYILADEHQDTNNAQNNMLELLANFSDNPNLFVVGDEKQAIFRFQGASLENFLYFKKKFKKAEVIFLSKNYRSGQVILDASHSLITKDEDREALKYRKNLISEVGNKSKLFFYRFSNEMMEHRFVAENIKEKLSKNVPPQEIAVLYRNNSDAFAISKQLKREGIEHVIESTQNLLLDEITWKITILLRAINDLSDNKSVGEVLYLDFLGVSTYDAHKVINSAYKNRQDIFFFIKNIEKVKDFAGDILKIKNTANLLEKLSIVSRNKHFLDALEIIISESGMLGYILRGGQENFTKLEDFFNQAKEISGNKPNYRLKDFMEHLLLMEEHDLVIKKTDSSLFKNKVRLMTAHSSKGLEFEIVYIIGFNDGHWGGKTSRDLFKLPLGSGALMSSEKDERKLFYVSLTRAKKECYLTSFAINESGKNILPSEFLGEIEPKYVEEVSTTDIEKDLKFSVKELKEEENDVSQLEKEYLINVFEDSGFSVSALNNYLECPIKYFFENMIRIPSAPERHQHYGNAVHESLNELFGLIEREKKHSVGIFLDIFKRNLSKKALSDSDFSDLLEKGEKSLPIFYKSNISNWTKGSSISEMNIAGVFIKGESKDIMLRGRIDRVDFIDSANVLVTDFKTSKPKSKKQMLNKNSRDYNYYRQLVFYKILVDNCDSNRYVMKEGMISFTEPDDKGRIKYEKFIIEDDEVESLKEVIKKCAEEIRSFDFINKGCRLRDCKHCALLSSSNYSSFNNDSTKVRNSK